MKQKGFTMVELLGILIILGLIIIVSAPPIIESLRTSKKNEYNNFLQKIYTASEVYVVENPDAFDWTKNDNIIVLRTLINNDYISGNTVNPNTEKNIYEEDSIIEVSKNSNNVLVFNYIYKEVD